MYFAQKSGALVAVVIISFSQLERTVSLGPRPEISACEDTPETVGIFFSQTVLRANDPPKLNSNARAWKLNSNVRAFKRNKKWSEKSEREKRL